MKKETAKAPSGHKAWVLNFGAGFMGAVAFHEMSQVVIEPQLFELPCSQVHCYQVILLRRRILPVINMVTLLTGEYRREAGEAGILGVAVYQREARASLSYVGLHLAATPTSVVVTDKQFCELPHSSQRWGWFTLSCFSHDGKKVPILDLNRLFSAELRDRISAASIPHTV